MKSGDLIRHYDAACGTGIVVGNLGRDLINGDILILWSDGQLEWCDPEMLELV